MILIIGIVVVLAMGMLLALLSGNADDRDQVPVDPMETEQQDKKDKKVRPMAEIGDHPGVSDTALNMYNARVDDITDTAQVAQLVEATDMRKELGGYLVTLKVKDDVDTLVIAFEKELKEGEDLAFDEAATWYAEQLLALIEEADAVQWSYKVEDAKEKTVKVLTTEQADELLKTEVKGYSESPELVQTLMNNQKGIV
jgi:hypothetical protein